MALWTTVLCLIIGYPFAYCLALYSGRMKKIAMILAIMPFWVSFLIRTYALMAILGSNGLVNSILLNLGLISKPLELMYNMFSVTVGMVYNYLVLMVLPLYASIEKVDLRVLEAARSLRANSYQTFIWVTLPLTMPGIYAGSVLVFVPAIGEFITPQLLGGAKVWMIGNYIYFLFLKARNYPLGAAHSIILIIIVGAMVILYMKYLGKRVMIL
jgi:spermidine/putrescine transport system permease protein